MKQRGIIAAAAIATAGIAAYLVKKKLRSRHAHDEHPSTDNSRHLTNVFARAKSSSLNK